MILFLPTCWEVKWKPFEDNAPDPANARKAPAATTTNAIKTRRLKKADCETEFFFMGWLVNTERASKPILLATRETTELFLKCHAFFLEILKFLAWIGR